MGWVHNLKDPDAPTHAPRLIAICLSFSIVAFLAVVLRFFVRFRTKRPLWVDDFATLSSAILGAAYSGIAIGQTRWGQALDPAYFPPENLIPFSKVQYAGGPVYTMALLGFKVALLASYLRIGGFVKAYRYTTYAVIAACTLNQVIFTFVITLACNPVAKQWDPSLPGSCIDTLRSYYAIAGTSLGFDIIIIALPLPVLWKLQLQKRQKIVLVGMFALGFFITIIQIFRIFTIKNLRTYTNSEPIVIWSIVEISLGVIITCIPTYAPLFHAFSSNLSSYRTRRRDPSYKLTSQNRHTQGSSSAHRKTPTTSQSQLGSQSWRGGGACDPEEDPDRTVHTTIMSTKNQGRSDADSEEHILAGNHGDGGRHSRGSGSGSGDGIQIHTVTEVKVERD